LGNNTMEFKFETTHLGLRRTTSEENKINVNDRISPARRTLCSLIKTGVHGTNGLNPRTSCKIYQVYVVQRLLYGLETLVECRRLNCLLWSSAFIGSTPRSK
jgi:hypothetical protein